MNSVEQSEKKPPVRRVGAFTMGISLIASGLIILISMVSKNFDLMMAAKLAPIVLILLGLEILISHFKFRGERLKYDFLSTIFCFFLIICSLGIAAIPTAFEYYGPQRYEQYEILSEDLYNDCYEVLKDNREIKSMDTDIHVYNQKYNPNLTYETLKGDYEVRIKIEFMGDYADKAEFVKNCRAVLDKINTLAPTEKYIKFSSNVGNNKYQLGLEDRFEQSLKDEDLIKLVEDENFME